MGVCEWQISAPDLHVVWKHHIPVLSVPCFHQHGQDTPLGSILEGANEFIKPKVC